MTQLIPEITIAVVVFPEQPNTFTGTIVTDFATP